MTDDSWEVPLPVQFAKKGTPQRFVAQWSVLLRQAGDILLPVWLWPICKLLSPKHWYRAAYLFSFVLKAAVMCLRPGRDTTLQARILDRLLTSITLNGGDFPIHIRVVGEGLLDSLAQEATSRGVVFCSGHLPLARVMLKWLLDRGQLGIVPVAAYSDGDEAILLPGRKELCPAIFTDGQALVKAKTVLRSGGTVGVLIDGGTCRPPISTNIMHLARRVGAKVLMWTCELEKDGTILLQFLNLPSPRCETDAGIEKNVRFLVEHLQRITC